MPPGGGSAVDGGDHAGALDFDAGRDLGVGEDVEVGKGRLEESAEGQAYPRVAQDQGGGARREHGLDLLG